MVDRYLVFGPIPPNWSYPPILIGKFFLLLGEQEWRSGESTRLPPVWLGLVAICGLSFFVGSLPYCSERFFYWYTCVLLTSKINFSKFQFDQESGRRRTIVWMCYLLIVIYRFIYINSPPNAYNFGTEMRFLLVSLADWVKITVVGEKNK